MVSMYLLLQDISPRTFVASAALFFGVVNLIKVPYYLYARLLDLQLLWRVAWLAPLLPLGVWVGKWGAGRVDRATFERIIVLLLIVSATLLIVQ
jgi:uncharacterized membrane protein YfcA